MSQPGGRKERKPRAQLRLSTSSRGDNLSNSISSFARSFCRAAPRLVMIRVRVSVRAQGGPTAAIQPAQTNHTQV